MNGGSHEAPRRRRRGQHVEDDVTPVQLDRSSSTRTRLKGAFDGSDILGALSTEAH